MGIVSRIIIKYLCRVNGFGAAFSPSNSSVSAVSHAVTSAHPGPGLGDAPVSRSAAQCMGLAWITAFAGITAKATELATGCLRL